MKKETFEETHAKALRRKGRNAKTMLKDQYTKRRMTKEMTYRKAAISSPRPLRLGAFA
jgi:hypothetical protein